MTREYAIFNASTGRFCAVTFFTRESALRELEELRAVSSLRIADLRVVKLG